MRQTLVLNVQGLPLLEGETQRFNFPNLPLKLFALTFQLLNATRCRIKPHLGIAPLAPGIRNLVLQRSQPGVGIKQHALCIAAQQRLMFMLPVNINQRLAHLPQLLNRNRRAVQICARAARAINDTAQQQSLFDIDILSAQPVGRCWRSAQIEFGANLGTFATDTDQATIGTLAQSKRQRID